jgi:hypothetical protein
VIDKDLEKVAQEAINTIESLNKILYMENYSDEEKIENIRVFVEEKLQQEKQKKKSNLLP